MYIPFLFALFLLVLFQWIRWRRKKLQLFRDLNIPGPEPNVFFGNFLELYIKGTIVCQAEWIRTYGKVLGYYHGLKPVLLVTDTELLKNIQIKDFQKFSDRPNIFQEDVDTNDMRLKHLISLKGANWKVIRSLITPTFTTKKMKMMSPIMSETIEILMEKLEDKCKSGEIFDAYDLYKGLTMDVIGRTAFGIRTNVQKNPKDPLMKLSNMLLHEPFTYFFILMTSSFPSLSLLFRRLRMIIGAITNKFSNPIIEFEKRCSAIIRARLQDPSLKRVDLLQQMIDTEVNINSKAEDIKSLIAGEDTEKDLNPQQSNDSAKGTDNAITRLSIDEVVANTFLFLVAGYETTSTALAFSTMVLVNFPEVQDKIRNEVDEIIEKEGKLDYGSVQKMQYFDCVFSEILRLYPPVHLFVNREAAEDLNYGRIRIRKGMSIQVPVYLLHRDSDYWPEPEKFKPERFSPENRTKNNPLAWQPFGAGPRNCVGMRFAQMEIKLALAEILHKYKLSRTYRTDTLPLDLHILPVLIRPKYGVPIKIERRDAS